MDPLLNKLDDQLVIPLRNDNEKNSWMDILEYLVMIDVKIIFIK